MSFRSQILALIQMYRRFLVRYKLWSYDEKIHKISSYSDCELLAMIPDFTVTLNSFMGKGVPKQLSKILHNFNELRRQYVVIQGKVVNAGNLCSDLLLELIQMPGTDNLLPDQREQLISMAKFIMEHGTTQQQRLFHQSMKKFPADVLPTDLREVVESALSYS